MENEKLLEIYNSWLRSKGEAKPKFVAFVDGDPVEEGDDYYLVAINASELRAARGENAELAIFDNDTRLPFSPKNI